MKKSTIVILTVFTIVSQLLLVGGSALRAADIEAVNPDSSAIEGTTEVVNNNPVVTEPSAPEEIITEDALVSPPPPEATPEPVVEPTPEVVPEPVLTEPVAPEPVLPEILPLEEVQNLPTLITDKADYLVGETVTIFGKFFQALQDIALKIFGGSLEEGTYTETNAKVTTDDQGTFTFLYQLDNIFRPLYGVVANNTLTGEELARTTFTDNIGYEKSGYDKGTSSWGTGNQSGYSENDWVQYQYTIKGITGAVPNFNVVFDELESNIIFVDALANFRVIVDAPAVAGNSRLPNGTSEPPSPDGTGDWWAFTPLNINYTYNASTHTCAGTDAKNTPTANHCFRIDPVAIGNSHFPSSFSDGNTHTVTIYFEAHMAATFVWSTGHEYQLGTAGIYGVHAPTTAVPSGVSFGTEVYNTWDTTAFKGAGGRNGAAKHFTLEDQSAGPSGAITLPIPAVTLPTGSITITKVTNPTPSTQMFGFTSDFGLFTLDTDSSDATYPNTITYSQLPVFTYHFSETLPSSPWNLTDITCINTTGNSTFTPVPDITTGAATINLVSGGAVTCTYTNTITQVTPSISTTPNPGSGIVGISLNDSANLSDGNNPTGSITFNLYSPADPTCSGTAAFTNTVSVSGNGTYDTSAGFASNAVGTWHWTATYSGDSNNASVSDACSAEPVTINKATPSVSTDIHDASHSIVTSVPAGTTVHDKAAVSGGYNPTGSVTFTFYNNGSCAPTGFGAGTVSLSGGVADPSNSEGPLNAGSYSFKAHYNGDTNNNEADSACEPLSVTKVNTTITTQVHNPSHVDVTNTAVALGTTIHDSATVGTKVDNINITGDITYRFYTTGNCTGSHTDQTVSVSNESSTRTPGAGSYSYDVVYGGDNNYNGATSVCEPITINKAQLDITTAVHNAAHENKTNSNVPLGSIMHDTATVTGGVEGFTLPAVSFTLTTGYVSTCDAGTAVNLGGTGDPIRTVDSNSLAAGKYAYRAVVAGDDNYIGDTSDCEPFTVDKAQLDITTIVHNATHQDKTNGHVPLGSVMHDTAAVTGGVQSFALPDVSFTLTNGYTGTCDQGSAVTTDGTEANGDTKSADSSALAAGAYAYRAVVAGDDNYLGDDSACEPFTVDKAQLTITTKVHDAAHADKTNGHVGLGSIMHDTAAVTGGVEGFTLPAISFTLTSAYTGTCANGVSVNTDGAEANGDTKSADSSALAAGAYAYRAVVAGDDNYLGDDSACEPFTVDKADTTVTTEVHNPNHEDITGDSVALGTTIHDSATVGTKVDNINITGDITYRFYTTGNCTGSYTDQTVSIGNESSTRTPGAGSYSYDAVYGGDDNYNGATSACEPFTVDKAQLDITTAVHNAAHENKTNSNVPLGSIMHDTAAVTGGVGGFDLPAVSFTLTTGYVSTCDAGTAVNLGGAVDPIRTVDSSALAAGVYAYRAVVATNDNYLGDTSACEPFTVDKAQLDITTAVHNGVHTDITNGHVDVGSIVHDTASVTGGVQGFTLPDVSFTLTSAYTGTCDSGSAVGNNGTENTAVRSADSSALDAGEYAYRAVVADNENYTGDTSDCEPFTVDKANPSISTTLSATTISIDDSAHDSATITGGYHSSGSATYTVYSDNACTQVYADAGTVTVTNGSVPDSNSVTFPTVGTYYWQVSYSGDANNNPAKSECNTEVLLIVTFPTRTLGFWQTHTSFTSYILANKLGGVILIGDHVAHKAGTGPSFGLSNGTTPASSELFGAFYAPISKTTSGTKRTPTEQARIQLLQQLVAAKLNCAAFGCSVSTLNKISVADVAYATGNKNDILNSASILDAYNNSQDNLAIPPELAKPGSATPDLSKLYANLTFWNTP